MDNKNNTTLEDFRMRYSILIDDIKYMKSRQWTVTYYLLVLYGAIVGFYKLMGFDQGKDFCVQKNVLIIMTLLVAVLGTIYQCDFQSRVTRYRKLLYGVIDHLSEEFRKFEQSALKERFKNAEGYISWWNGFWLFTFPFILMLWIGAGLVYW